MNFNNLKKNNGTLPLNVVAQEFGITQNRGQVIPGRFYSFKTTVQVPAITEEFVQIHNKRNYLDLNPVGLLLFHDNWKETALVLNLKVMPPRAAAKILEAYWQFSQLNGLNNLFDKDEQLLPLEERRLIDNRFYLITPTALSTILGVNNLNYAINKYNMDHVMEAKLIDWDNFGMLINPTLTTDGLYPDPINLAKVFDDFLTNTLV
ncbi:hypothetical protein UFOVP1247_193 [uncultured Caudovirales phage]|uniref:Uncharacterized protein n=1 Tax=uncultured Caudovirales phage TaxID=2100421 RepID=A0A6J5RD37_9CAUD|nr:hypothetical protein UFOVP970_233 [uncultured Caudovirales phage]CAB4193822.1 hypothetical protein UFOVP1247_193 [uncultured Caudovirales phage]